MQPSGWEADIDLAQGWWGEQLELNAGYSTLLLTDIDILYLFVGVYGVLGRKENVRCLWDFVFRVWGRCLEVSRILLWIPIGVFTREVGQELPRVILPSFISSPKCGQWPSLFLMIPLLPSQELWEAELFSVLVMRNIQLTGDQERNSLEWNLPPSAGQLWGTAFHSPGKTLRGKVTLFSLCRQNLTQNTRTHKNLRGSGSRLPTIKPQQKGFCNVECPNPGALVSTVKWVS